MWAGQSQALGATFADHEQAVAALEKKAGSKQKKGEASSESSDSQSSDSHSTESTDSSGAIMKKRRWTIPKATTKQIETRVKCIGQWAAPAKGPTFYPPDIVTSEAHALKSGEMYLNQPNEILHVCSFLPFPVISSSKAFVNSLLHAPAH